MTTGDPLLDFALSLRSGALTPVMKAVSDLNSAYAYLVFVPLVYWLFSRRIGFILLVSDAVGTLLAVVLKASLAMPRPPNAGESAWLATATGWGFPSGHTTAAATTWFSMAGSLRARRLAAFGGLVAVSAGFSRLYLGVHYTRDIAGGLAIGLGIGALLWAKLPEIEAALGRWPFKRRLLLVAAFPAAALFNASNEALIIVGATTGATLGQILADRWGWKVETGGPWRLPFYGAMRVAIGLPALGVMAMALGDPSEAAQAEVLARFLALGLFVTLVGPRVFGEVESRLAPKATRGT